MPTQKNNKLEFSQHMKSDKIVYGIYSDIEFLIKKTNYCKNLPEKSSTKTWKTYSLLIFNIKYFFSFNHIENKHSFYRGKHCIKKVF